MNKRLKEILQRKTEIRSLLESGQECDLEAVKKELEDLETEKRSIEARAEIAGKINIGTITGTEIKPPTNETRTETNKLDSIEYRQAFMHYVLKGEKIPTEIRADAITMTTDIGTVIPTTIVNTIVEKMESQGMILPLVTRTAYKGGVAIPTSNVKPRAEWVSEGKGSEKQKKTTGKVVFAYHKLRCAVAVSLETDTMALSAFEATLIKNVTEAMVRAIEEAIIGGSGVGEPEGVLTTEPEAAQIVESKTCGYKDLIAMEAPLPLAYETKAVWVMTKKTFMTFAGETDTNGQPIGKINMGISGRPERSLLGRQVICCDYLESYMATLEAGKVFTVLFDFSDYILNTNYAMTVKKYEDNETDDQVTKAIMLADGKVVDKGSLVVLKKKV